MFAKIGDLKSGIISSEKNIKIKIVGMVSTRTRIQIGLQKPLDQILPELHCSERKKKSSFCMMNRNSRIYLCTFLSYQREVTFGVMCDNYVSQ